jgi:hypothetical protein
MSHFCLLISSLAYHEFSVYFILERLTPLSGMWISISRHWPNRRADQHFHSPRQKPTGQKQRKGQGEGEKNLARLAIGFVFLLANPEFYSHLASWRVVIRTPGVDALRENARARISRALPVLLMTVIMKS